MASKTSPIQAIRLALAYAKFSHSELVADVHAILNSLEEDFDELSQKFNAEGYSEQTYEETDELLKLIAELITTPEDSEEVVTDNEDGEST